MDKITGLSQNPSNLEILLYIAQQNNIDISELKVSHERTEFILLRAIALAMAANSGGGGNIGEAVNLSANTPADIPIEGVLTGFVVSAAATIKVGDNGDYGTFVCQAGDTINLGLLNKQSIKLSANANTSVQAVVLR